ncbi:MAG TPA: FAD-dependent oxidoreductase [Gaiella sp.]|nr:FAD-dependent oxidoreductase [Gaiella sp.]
MSRDADIVVVGAGIAGAATARALAGAAGTVVLLEQFELGHPHGSSHGTSRIFRLNYPDERFVRMAQAAAEGWRELEEHVGAQLIERTGVIDLGPATSATERALAACGAPTERMSAQALAERWPINLRDGETALLQPDGGIIRADRAHAAFVSAAAEGGVEVKERTPVRRLALEPQSVRLTLDTNDITARAVVVTAGAWAPVLLAEAGIRLDVVPTRETVVYLELAGADAMPPLIDYAHTRAADGVERPGHSGYALGASADVLKAGLHQSGPVANPDEQTLPDGALAEWVAGWARSRYDGLIGAPRSETCLYTNTSDERFVLERHGPIVVGSACSGHGFKFAPVVGQTLAALAREAAA